MPRSHRFLYLIFDTWRVNSPVVRGEPVAQIHRYKFRQVAVLSLAYFVTFGSELAVVSILPLFFKDTFALSLAVAGLVGASFGIDDLLCPPRRRLAERSLRPPPVLLVCLSVPPRATTR